MEYIPGKTGGRRHIVEGPPGHGARFKSVDRRGRRPESLHRQLRRYVASVLQAVSERATRQSVVRKGTYGHTGRGERDLLRHTQKGRAKQYAASGFVHRGPGSIFGTWQLAAELRRLVCRPGSSGTHVQ